jgi:hypothetical protein
VCPEAERELRCFPNNAAHMRYRWFCSRGLFTGSGVAGAATALARHLGTAAAGRLHITQVAVLHALTSPG